MNHRIPAATALTSHPTSRTFLPMPERLVVNFDNYGTCWGIDTVSATNKAIDEARADGDHIDEWNVTDRDGHPTRIVRIADPSFLDTICVIPTGARRG